MGRILILEPQPDLQELVRRVAARLGHEALTDISAQQGEVDAVVAEPESYKALTLAQQLRDRSPELPIIFASMAPPNERTRALRPIVHLQKPFALQELQHALSNAVPAGSSNAD